MLIQETEQVIIAVRLYDNKTYGTTYGKGKYRRAIYNGTIEVKAVQATYLVDFYNFEDWANSAKTDAQMELLANVEPDGDTMYSWIKHYDRRSQEKVLVYGLCAVNLDSSKMVLLITDQLRGVVDGWELDVKPCKTGKTGAPQLLATNTDLGTW